jgi:Arc/MetJ-type ribon-helix-helix transcriptional regulator
MTDQKKGKSLTLPADLYDRIDERARSTGFGSVEEYVTFVMEEVLKEENREPAFSKEDEEEVKKRLKSLGYLE